MLETVNICKIYPDKPNRRFENEKQTYKYVEKMLDFQKSFKLFSMVLKGIPDYIVSEIGLYRLEAGFYEVKFENRKLSPTQVKLIKELVKLSNVYIIRVFRDGTIIIDKVKRRDDEQTDKDDKKRR